MRWRLGLLGLALALAASALPGAEPPAAPPAPAWPESPAAQPIASGQGVVPAMYEQGPASPGAAPLSAGAPAPAKEGPAAAGIAAPAPLASQGREPPLGLGSGSRSGHGPHSAASGGLSSAISVGSSLAVVLGLFFLVAWGIRRASPHGAVLLPGEVFEVLGRAPLSGRQQVHLLRCGNKLVLVSVTPAGAEAITEVTDPVEVDRLSGLCRQAHPQSATAAFRHVFQQLAPRSAWQSAVGREARDG